MPQLQHHIFLEDTEHDVDASNLSGVERLGQRNGFVVQGVLESDEVTKLERLLRANRVDQLEQHKESNFGFSVSTRSGAMSSDASNIGRILDDIGLGDTVTIEPVAFYNAKVTDEKNTWAKGKLKRDTHDRMTQGTYTTSTTGRGSLKNIFVSGSPEPVEHLDVRGSGGKQVLMEWCKRVKTSLNDGMIDRLIKIAHKEKRTLTDVECYAFSQANSEHCRHQTFNAAWKINGKMMDKTCMDLIKATYEANPHRVLSAYSDNSAVFRRENDDPMKLMKVDETTGQYYLDETEVALLAKVETHNHPTAISPDPGAKTGVGGEIRDEGATGLGGYTGHGTSSYMVNDALFDDPYDLGQNPALATPAEIMVDAPLGATRFGNEYGRPSGTGTFTTFTANNDGGYFGFAKPIMGAGGLGMIEKRNAFKPEEPLPVGTKLIQIGGPGFLIGMGGATGSSAGLAGKDADFSSVQRGNAEMQRRCQKVIDRCSQMKQNPILAIHDVGAGGIGNAFVELGEMGKQGAEFWMDKAMVGDESLSDREIWSNEAQERYVLALSDEDYDEFVEICESEGLPLSWMGIITEGDRFNVKRGDEDLINMEFEDFFYKESPIIETETKEDRGLSPLELTMSVSEAVDEVLSNGTVGDKSFLATIGDQKVGGLTTQYQMVGPHKVPVADVAVRRDGFEETTGNAMVSGEALALAPIDPAASVRMALTESLTNLLASDVTSIENVIFSGNWMANLKDNAQYIDLYTAVQAASEFCIELGIAIPTGKDSFSMQAEWKNKLEQVKVGAPVTGLFTAFSPVADADATVTPYLQPVEDSQLLFIDLADGQQRLGGSILAQVHQQLGNDCPDITADKIKNLYRAIIQLKREGHILAYHDKSAGGLMAALGEMAFASHCGLDIDFSDICSNTEEENVLKALFNQEGGIVVQIADDSEGRVMDVLGEFGLGSSTHPIARPQFVCYPEVKIGVGGTTVFSEKTEELHKTWSTTSDKIRKLRENPETVTAESDAIHDYSRGAVEHKRNFDLDAHPAHDIIDRYNTSGEQKPKVAILRAPGTNGDQEMAYKFMQAGFDVYDVSMAHLKSGRFDLKDFDGLAACGGFSYGDTLGAGTGWAQSVLCDEGLSAQFRDFFHRPKTWSLGVCNGDQFMAQISELIPDADHFPSFERNTSNIFEARSVDALIPESNAVPFRGMAGSIMPIYVAHGEGRNDGEGGILQYVDETGTPTMEYPYNPNGSTGGNAGYTNGDGRHSIMMPHPERDDEFDYMFLNFREFSEEQKKAS